MTTIPFELYKKFVENGQLKVEICLKKKKTPPEHKYSVNSLRKFEQKQTIIRHA